MRVLVTGATGLLGNSVARTLCEAGDEVSALVRSAPDPEVFAGLNINLVHADLATPVDSDSDQNAAADGDQGDGGDSDGPDRLESAIADCDAVIHCAAMIHLGWKNIEESVHVNGGGTRRLANACLNHGKKMVLVGTVDSIGLGSPDCPGDENTPIDAAGGAVPCAYVVSKRAALQVANEYAERGLNVVTCHPGFMLGPWDWKPSSGRMILEVGKGWKPIAPSGGCSVCDARDVASGVIEAMRRPCRPGRQYVLAGHNWTYMKIWTEMAKRMGTRPPMRRAGPGMEFLAGLAGDAIAKVTGKEPDFNSAAVRMSSQFHWYSSDRAKQELGYQTRPAEQTLDDAAEWVKQRFVLSGDA